MNEIPLLKVVVVGDGAVGKTTLIRRYCEGKFHASRVATIGVDFYTQQVQLPDSAGVGAQETVKGRVRLSIWDLAGQEQFEVVRTGFYRGSRAAALVYDVTSMSSLRNLKRWRDEVLQALPGQLFLVVGNKVDLDRTVSSELGRKAAAYFEAPYVETSALTGEGVAELFETLAMLAVRGLGRSHLDH
jgi:small GTP-binding protein